MRKNWGNYWILKQSARALALERPYLPQSREIHASENTYVSKVLTKPMTKINPFQTAFFLVSF